MKDIFEYLWVDQDGTYDVETMFIEEEVDHIEKISSTRSLPGGIPTARF